MSSPPDPLALLRSRSYIVLLVVAAIIGAPVSALAYFFLALVSKMQGWIFTDLPKGVGFHAEPLWWPLLPLLLAGILVGLTIRYLPGRGGHSPADGFKAGAGPPSPRDLAGILLAAFATLSLGVVLGPEATPDRPWRRPRRPRGQACEAGRSSPDPGGGCRGRQFRRHQHVARVPA